MPSKHDPVASLADILENLERIEGYVAGLDREAFGGDTLRRDAVERQSRVDGKQRLKQLSGPGSGSHQELAPAWLDAGETPGNTRRHWRCGDAICSEQARWITGQVIYADGDASLMTPEVPPEIQFG